MPVYAVVPMQYHAIQSVLAPSYQQQQHNNQHGFWMQQGLMGGMNETGIEAFRLPSSRSLTIAIYARICQCSFRALTKEGWKG